jgi:hypothetical protein
MGLEEKDEYRKINREKLPDHNSGDADVEILGYGE